MYVVFSLHVHYESSSEILADSAWSAVLYIYIYLSLCCLGSPRKNNVKNKLTVPLGRKESSIAQGLRFISHPTTAIKEVVLESWAWRVGSRPSCLSSNVWWDGGDLSLHRWWTPSYALDKAWGGWTVEGRWGRDQMVSIGGSARDWCLGLDGYCLGHLRKNAQ